MAYAYIVEPVEAGSSSTAIRVRRRSLPAAYEDLTWQLLMVVEALARLHRDNRFPRHRHAVQHRNLLVVNDAAAKLFDVRDVLGSDGTGAS